MPVRNPVILAKELATIDHISGGRLILGTAVGWYRREFESLGADFTQRGRQMEQGLEILKRLWTEDIVDGDYPPYKLRGAVLQPKPVQKPHPPILIGGYVDAVLKRVATKGDGWLTYYYTVESFKKAWARIRAFAEEAGRDPDELSATNQLPICIGPRAKVEGPMKHWLQTEWDYASWSESTMDSAIMGTPEECVEQLGAHIEAGLDRIIFVPFKYETEQVEAIAQQIIPRLNKRATVGRG
jgi:alkanesulfonate monooxygenase